MHDGALVEGLDYTFGSAYLDRSSFSRHSHDYSELILIRGGEGIHETESGDYPVRAGDVYVIHKGESHGFRNCRNLNMVNIGFPEEVLQQKQLFPLTGFHALFFLEPLYRKQHHFTSRLHLAPHEMEKIRESLDQMGRETEKKRPGFQLLFTSLFQIMVIRLCRYYEKREPEKSADLMKVSRSLAVLEQNYRENISICDLAQQSGYSLNHFSRLCEKVYGLPPLQYIIQLRLARAVELLENSNLTIGEVAGECGYDDSNYFCRIFRKKMGCSPREYRCRNIQ